MFEPALHASRAQRISLVAGAILACMIVPREGRASWGATVTQDRSTFLSNRTQLETITFDNLSVGPHDPIIATYGRVQNGSGGTLNVVQNAQATSPPNVVTEFGAHTRSADRDHWLNRERRRLFDHRAERATLSGHRIREQRIIRYFRWPLRRLRWRHAAGRTADRKSAVHIKSCWLQRNGILRAN